MTWHLIVVQFGIFMVTGDARHVSQLLISWLYMFIWKEPILAYCWLLFWFIFFLLLSCFSVFIFQLLTSYEMNSMYLPFPPLQGVFSLWRLSHLSWTESSFHVLAFTIAAQLLGSYPKPHYPAQSQASVLYSLSVIEFVVCAVIIVALVLQASDLVFTKVWTCTLFSFTAEKYSILYMYHVFIIFSELKDIYVVSIY